MSSPAIHDAKSLDAVAAEALLLQNSTTRDVATQLQAALAEVARLQEQLNLRDQALDSMSTEFSIVTHQPPDSRIAYCNRAMAQHYGYERTELIGQHIGVISPPSWTRENYQQIDAALRAGETVRFEEQVRRKDGGTFWSGTTIAPLHDAAGKTTHAICIGADITAKRENDRQQRALQEQLVNELKERERILIELRTAQKLESVGRLAAGVAHEINTPIQYVSDSLFFLRSACDDLRQLLETWRSSVDSLGSDSAVATLQATIAEAEQAIDLPFLLDEMPKAFERTFDGVNRVATIVRAMKEFSHPDATEFSQADINHALQTTLIVAGNEFKYLASVQTQFAELPPVVCNIGELNQVFLNMIVNAAHAIHDAGKDTASGVISITTALAGEQVEIIFTDNGCGIPQENLDKIYDPFFTTKEVGRGTGQGLAITRSIIVDKHGGQVEAHSEMGIGTRFVIRLPVGGRTQGAVT